MRSLTSKQRQLLRGKAHHLKPILIIGKNGLYSGGIIALSNALDAHELIKIKFKEFKHKKKQIAIQICKELSCEIVGIVGNVIILYRYNPQIKQHKYEFVFDV